MNFTSSKYPRILLGIFFCLSFFLAMPVTNTFAVGDQTCKTEPFIIPKDQHFALIIRNNGQIGSDNKSTPSGTACYVPVKIGDTTISYEKLRDTHVISAGWADIETMQVYLACNDDYDDELHVNEWDRNPGRLSNLQMKLQETDGCLILQKKVKPNGEEEVVGSYKHDTVKNKRTGYGINIGNDNQDQYLFFVGFKEGDKTAAEKLLVCKDALAIHTIKTAGPDEGKNCDPKKYIPADKIDSQDFFEKEGLSSMPLECKQMYETCMTGGAKEDPNKNDPRYGKPDGYNGPLPDCAFSYDGCRNINDILQFLVNIGQEVFKYIGTFAFVMFIYGGFMYIISMGNAEKAKKGQEILTAAIIGIIISFSAYLIIDFVLDALQVGQEFRAIGTFEGTDAIEKPDPKKPNGS